MSRIIDYLILMLDELVEWIVAISETYEAHPLCPFIFGTYVLCVIVMLSFFVGMATFLPFAFQSHSACLSIRDLTISAILAYLTLALLVRFDQLLPSGDLCMEYISMYL